MVAVISTMGDRYTLYRVLDTMGEKAGSYRDPPCLMIRRPV